NSRIPPTAGVTVRLSARVMACDFSVIMNPGPTEQIEAAGQALEVVNAIEAWLSIYRETSELSVVNRRAGESPVSVRRELFELLQKASEIYDRTDGAFDMATGALTRLWRDCRRKNRIPVQAEIDLALNQAGLEHIDLQVESQSVAFRRPGIILDPGAIGKGYGLDEASDWLKSLADGPDSFLLHGGHSSLIARGGHNSHRGWPVGIGNPLFTEKRLGTLLLCDQAMATSGSNIQFFRHEGKRYGHILDPRTSWPIDGMLSVTVLAPSAAIADALSTAFFVMGVEKARQYCENWPDVGAILLPFPDKGNKVQPTLVNIPPEFVFWDEDQVIL
ncbi:MAG: FAD:protein FMN transferase, partial [Planctomycetota bacterium]|nr:FAD:protein FMN transferase [Planctomycetota bacterium]